MMVCVCVDVVVVVPQSDRNNLKVHLAASYKIVLMATMRCMKAPEKSTMFLI